MPGPNPPFTRSLKIVLTLASIAYCCVCIDAQEAPAVHAGYTRITGVPDDWTHHHVVFTNPGSEQDAIRTGKQEQWLKIVNNPRYVMHQLKHNLPVQGLAADDVNFRLHESREEKKEHDHVSRHDHDGHGGKGRGSSTVVSIKRDWSMSQAAGTTTAAMGANQYPAKYNFSVKSASCSDYVIFPTGLPGSATQATVVAYNNLYEGTCSGTVPGIYWTYNTGGTSTLSPVLYYDGIQVAYIQSSGGVASLVLLTMANSGGTVGNPAALTSVSNANYKGCAAPCYTTIPFSNSADDTNSAPYYDYDTDSLYAGDNNGALHKFTNIFGQGTGAPAPAEITGGGTSSGWPQTMASGVTLTGPVYDAMSGNVFVGSSGGFLYRIPAAGGSNNVVASAQLAATGSTGIVDPPLIDTFPGTPNIYVFVGDTNGAGLAAVEQFSATFGSGAGASASETVSSGASSTGAILYAGAFDNLHYAIAGGTAGNMYVCGVQSGGAGSRLFQIAMNASFNGAVTSTTTDPSSGASQCSPVTEFLGSKANTSLSADVTSTSQTAVSIASGTGIATNDYVQIDSEILQVTGGAGTTTLTVSRGQLGTTAATHSNGASVQDIQDWVFLSVSANATAQGSPSCGGGASPACLFNYLVTTGTVPSAATAGISATGGSSGVSIDNSSTETGASQIYYTTLGNATCPGNGTTGAGTHGCAVQVSQSLQGGGGTMALVGTPVCGSVYLSASPTGVLYTEQAAGDQIVVGTYDFVGNQVTGVTDNGASGGSTYSQVATSTGGAWIYGTVSSASGVTTINIAGTTGDTIGYCVQEYSGAARFGNATRGLTNSPYSFTLTTQDNGNHVFALLTLAGSSPCGTPTASTGTIQASNMTPFRAEWSQDVPQTVAGTATVSGACSGMNSDPYIAVELRTQ